MNNYLTLIIEKENMLNHTNIIGWAIVYGLVHKSCYLFCHLFQINHCC